jgi:tripartite-type tricarboxylate transporter receptor subunit TctC
MRRAANGGSCSISPLAACYGLGAPKSISIEIVEKLNGEINAGLANANIKGRLADLGAEPMPMTPGDFGKLIENR